MGRHRARCLPIFLPFWSLPSAGGEICVLLGPSGSGKSTLLNIIGGIDSADAGFISIGGDKLEDMARKRSRSTAASTWATSFSSIT